MSTFQRIGSVVLALLTVSHAQDTCKVKGFDDARDVNDIRVATGSISDGDLSISAYLYRPLVPQHPSPPVLFSHSDIEISKTKTDLRPIAAKLAKDGAMVLVLDRTVMWEPRDELANRDPHLPDCASRWLFSRQDVDVLHGTYVGPRFAQSGRVVGRLPQGFIDLKQSPRDLYVPLAESEGGRETISLTTADGQEGTVKAIETHWSVEVVRIPGSSNQ